jgi:hypothetical protein
MSQQSVKQAARRSALDAQAVLRKEWADRERRLEALAVAALTALAERDALVRDAEQRGGQALRTMTEGEDLSVREAVDWCGSGVTVREITRLLRLAGGRLGGQTAASDERQAGPAGSRRCMIRPQCGPSGRTRCACRIDCRWWTPWVAGRRNCWACTPRAHAAPTVLVGPVPGSDVQMDLRGFGASV